MAAWSCRCCRWSTTSWSRSCLELPLPAHEVLFSVFHTDPSDKGLMFSKRFRRPSSFHPPPPELSSFLQEKHSYGVSYSAILSLSSLWMSEATEGTQYTTPLFSVPLWQNRSSLMVFFSSTNSLHKIIVFPNLHFNFIWAKLALELLHEIHVIVAKLSRCCFLEVVYPFLICIVHAPISDCYYTGIIKLLIHSPLKTEHLVPAFSFPCLWIAF